MYFVIAENNLAFSYVRSAIEHLDAEQRNGLRLLDFTEPGTQKLLEVLNYEDKLIEPSHCIFVTCLWPAAPGSLAIQAQDLPQVLKPAYLLPETSRATYRILTKYFYTTCIIPVLLPPSEHNDTASKLPQLLSSLLNDFVERAKQMHRIFEEKTHESHEDTSFRRVLSRKEIAAMRRHSDALGETLRFTYSMKRELSDYVCRAAFYSCSKTMLLLEQYRNIPITTKNQAKEMLDEMLCCLDAFMAGKDM